MCLREIEELTQQKHSLGLQVQELEVKVHNLSSLLEKKEEEAEVRRPRPHNRDPSKMSSFTPVIKESKILRRLSCLKGQFTANTDFLPPHVTMSLRTRIFG